MTELEWLAEGKRRFGPDKMKWRFICPSCGHVAACQDWRTAGAPSGCWGFSCVGRWMGAEDGQTFQGRGGPCQYAGGGLIGLNPVRVTGENVTIDMFDFADEEVPPCG